MKLRTAGLTLAATATLLLGACGGDAGMSASSTTPTTSTTSVPATSTATSAGQIVVKDFSFTTKQLTVKVGESVTWTNQDAFLHTVTSGQVDGPTNVPDGMFDHPLPGNGGSATVTFAKAGTFTYYCKQHNAMNGTITVTA